MKTTLIPILALAIASMSAVACSHTEDTPSPQSAMAIRNDNDETLKAERGYETEELRGEYRADLEIRMQEMDKRIASLGASRSAEVTVSRDQLKDAWNALQNAAPRDFAEAKSNAEDAYRRLDAAVTAATPK